MSDTPPTTRGQTTTQTTTPGKPEEEKDTSKDKYGNPKVSSYKTPAAAQAEKARIDARLLELKQKLEAADPEGRTYEQIQRKSEADFDFDVDRIPGTNIRLPGGGLKLPRPQFGPGGARNRKRQQFEVEGRDVDDVVAEVKYLEKRLADVTNESKRSSLVPDSEFVTAANAEATSTNVSAQDLALWAQTTNENLLDPRNIVNLWGQGGEDKPDAIWLSGAGNIPWNEQRIAYGPDTNVISDENRADIIAKIQSSKKLTLRQAANQPFGWSQGEVQRWAEELWKGGFLSIQGYDITKSFGSQYAADRYDPAFQNAWQSLIHASIMDPTKSMLDILSDRQRVRAPMLAEERAKAAEEKVKEAMRRVNVMDPVGIAQQADAISQQELRRNLSDDERRKVVDYIRTLESQQIASAMDDKAVMNIDTSARIAEMIENDHAVEARAVDTADAFSAFKRIIRGDPVG